MNDVQANAYKVLDCILKSKDSSCSYITFTENEYKRNGVLIYRENNTSISYYEPTGNRPVQMDMCSTLDPFDDDNFFQMQLLYNDDIILMYSIIHLLRQNNIKYCYMSLHPILGDVV